MVLLWVCSYFLSTSQNFVFFYNHHIYAPFQSFRLIIFGIIPFSIGDVLYVLGGVWLLVTIIRWIKYTRTFSASKTKLASSLLNTANVALLVYFLFILGWGANYYKPHLGESWQLAPLKVVETKQIRRAKDSMATLAFNIFLLEKVNTCALHYTTLPYSIMHDRAVTYYQQYTDSRVKQNGLGVKATLFSYFMQRMGVDGYYNPFTGEGQVSTRLPTFMMPFTVCHEMAHQAGIAPEGDANLLAYAIATSANDPVFQYSAYLNLWLYANHRLWRYDSASAQQFEKQLNPLTLAHIDTLEQINNECHGFFSQCTSYIYDRYLRTQNQTEGIKSYGNVTKEAWQLEQKRLSGKRDLIRIP